MRPEVAIALSHRPPPMEMFGIEMLYFFIVAALCLIIYFKTKEIYELTKHRGIFHFRNIFLYFFFAYFFRFSIMAYSFATDLGRPPLFFVDYILLFSGYFSTMAILSLVMTVIPKRYRYIIDKRRYYLHIVSLAASVVVWIFRSQPILLVLQILIFFGAIVYITLKAHRGFISKNKYTFILLFIFWILNVIVSIRSFLRGFERLPIYILSIGVFVWLFLRVIKRLNHDQKKR